MTKTQNLAIIDGDSICYICSKDTLTESITRLDDLISDIIDKTGSTHYYLFLSTGPYFRHDINPDYKGKRKKGDLKYLKTLKTYLIEQYSADILHKVEADDAVSYVANQVMAGKIKGFDSSAYTVCAIDKDVKGQVEGQWYDYKTLEFGHTKADEADYFLHMQSIMGDSGDNITGIFGVGEVKARELLDAVPDTHRQLAALKAYQTKFKNPGEALYQYQKNYRQVYMLKTDADFMNEVGYEPKLLTPIEIN